VRPAGENPCVFGLNQRLRVIAAAETTRCINLRSGIGFRLVNTRSADFVGQGCRTSPDSAQPFGLDRQCLNALLCCSVILATVRRQPAVRTDHLYGRVASSSPPFWLVFHPIVRDAQFGPDTNACKNARLNRSGRPGLRVVEGG
jgi:hypothetical protein